MSKRLSMASSSTKSGRRASARAPVKSLEQRWSNRRKVRKWQKEDVIIGTMTLNKWMPIEGPVEYIDENQHEPSPYESDHMNITSQSSRGSPSSDKPLTRSTRSSLGFDSDHLESLPADLKLKGVKSLSSRIQQEQQTIAAQHGQSSSSDHFVSVSSDVDQDGLIRVNIVPYTNDTNDIVDQATQKSADMEDDTFDRSMASPPEEISFTSYSVTRTPAHMHDHSQHHHHHSHDAPPDDTDHNPAPPSHQALHLGLPSVTPSVTPSRTPAFDSSPSQSASPASALLTPGQPSPAMSESDTEMRDVD